MNAGCRDALPCDGLISTRELKDTSRSALIGNVAYCRHLFTNVNDMPRSREQLDPYHLGAGAQAIEVVGPGLHHLAAFREALSLVVGRPHFVALGMRELLLDHVRGKSLLIEQLYEPRTDRRVHGGTHRMEAKVGIEPAYTALQAAA